MITAEDGKKLGITVRDGAAASKGVVLAVHGMGEHCGRQGYARFAERLNAEGYIYLGLDLRGHGKTDPDTLGAGGRDFWDKSKSDIRQAIDYAAKAYGLPVILYGYCLGSFLIRGIMREGLPEGIERVILSGTARAKGIKFTLGRAAAFFKKLFGSGESPGRLFGIYLTSRDNRFKEGINCRLTRDVAEAGRYNIDPTLGSLGDYNFFGSVFRGFKELQKKPAVPDKKIPLLITGGGADFLSRGGRDLPKISRKYGKVGYGAEFKIYAGARQDLLNELNHDEVTDDIIGFLGR